MSSLGGPEWKEMELNSGSGLCSDKGVLGGLMFFCFNFNLDVLLLSDIAHILGSCG